LAIYLVPTVSVFSIQVHAHYSNRVDATIRWFNCKNNTMQLLSHTLKVALAVSRTISASISLFASCIIVFKIAFRYCASQLQRAGGVCSTLYSDPMEITTYHRILLGIAILDILHTSWAALSTLPVPASSGVVFGQGNTASCTAQGFFIQLSTAIPIYMASLNTYFMLKIRYNVPNDIIRTKYEPWFHLIPVTQALLSGCIGISLKLYNPIVIPEMGCWIALYPPFCDILGNCSRGYKLDKLLDFYVWVFAYGWLFLSFLIVLVNSILIYSAIRSQELRNERYLFRTAESNERRNRHNNMSSHLSSQQNRQSIQSGMSVISSKLPSEIQIENNDIAETDEIIKASEQNPIHNDSQIESDSTTMHGSRDRSGALADSKTDSNLSRIRKGKLSRTAASQSLLFCSSTFFVAFWVFMPWVAIKIRATENAIFFFAFMVNIVNPSQGIFNLFIIVRLHYKRLRTAGNLSRRECIRKCLFSPDIH
jgi:hypothetical protein